METVFLWFLLSIAVGVWADNKGRSGFSWFLLAMFLSPLLGLIFCAISKDLSKASQDAPPSDKTHVKCSACAEYVLPDAVKCKHCAAPLQPQPNFIVQQARDEIDIDSPSNLIFVAVLIAVGLALFYLLRLK